MNGNRMKYASTPTYGMQKRGFLKKPAPSRPVSEAPDFSKAPGAAGSMPFQQTIPQSAAQQPFVQQSAFGQQPPLQQPLAQIPWQNCSVTKR